MSTAKMCGSIADFYARKSVFITGGTGFLGKVFVEKILYSCPQIDKLYVLVREKRGVSPQERHKQYLDNQIFTRLRQKRPEDLNKIVPIRGDITGPNLGMKPDDVSVLEEKVDIVIHSAATIRFDEPLEVAWKTNVEGTQMMLDLSKRMRSLKAFIYISTAYTNTNRKCIDEVLYPPPAAFNDVQARIKNGVTDEETKQILKDHPNTYTFTKALTEHIVADNHGIIPVVIVRPSIVTAAIAEPTPGWLDNWYGGTGITIATAQGLNRIIYGKKAHSVNVIPVDYVTNLVIVAGARHDRYHKSKDVAIYNSCISDCNPITLGKVVSIFREEFLKSKNSTFSIPLMFSTNEWVIWFVTFSLQIIPSYCADFWRQMRGKSPRFVKMQSMLIQTRSTVAFFITHNWIFKSAATRSLHAELTQSDKRTFPCDPTHINKDEYFRKYYRGVEKYLMKKV